jgi:hypothetical protein
MKIGDFAFWGYDRFPYVLGDRIRNIGEPRRATEHDEPYHRRGTVLQTVYTERYGYGFLPRHICPSDKGRAVFTELEQLGVEYQRAQSKLQHEYMSKALAIAPFLRKFPNYSDFLPSKAKG